jgi:hypothetical protein
MGGAITRGWLQLAKDRDTVPRIDHALSAVTTVIFLQGAVQGSWLAGAAEGASLHGPAVTALADSECSQRPGAVGCLDPNRAGVIDLAPNSEWYSKIAASGPPPQLHYYSFSTYLRITITEQFVLWPGSTVDGPADVPGDGLMELGNTGWSSPAAGGGSIFSPFGQRSDQHYYVITRAHDTTVQVGLPVGIDGAVLYATGAATAVFSDPYSHFNFGDKIGQLTLLSCLQGEGVVKVVDEITRDLGAPSAACSSGSAAASANLPTPSAVVTRLSSVSAMAGRVGLIRQPVTFADRYGRAQLTLYTRGPHRGRFTLTLSGHGYLGVIPERLLRGRTAKLNVAITAFQANNTTGPTVRVRLRGTLAPGGLQALLRIQVARPRLHATLATPRPDVPAAVATTTELVRALRRNDFLGIARLLDPSLRGGLSTSQLATRLAAQHILVSGITVGGHARTLTFADGNPGWTQPVTVRSHGRRPLRVQLVLEQFGAHWWVIGSTS